MNGNRLHYQPISPQKILKHAAWIIPLIVILAVAGTSVYMVNTDAKGVVQQFGKFVRITEPGIHLKLPFGIEKVQKPQVERIFKEEFVFRYIPQQERWQARFGLDFHLDPKWKDFPQPSG
ncbi:MAG: hypothetical protein ACYTE8_10070 [Planctomycetota bacterium]|jgi:hypothetical protein